MSLDFFFRGVLTSLYSCDSAIRKLRALSAPHPHSLILSWPLSLLSNRSRILPTYTSPTSLCPWTSRSWRTCWSPSARPFPLASSVTPMEPAEEWALPGISFGYLVTCIRTAGWLLISDGVASSTLKKISSCTKKNSKIRVVSTSVTDQLNYSWWVSPLVASTGRKYPTGNTKAHHDTNLLLLNMAIAFNKLLA